MSADVLGALAARTVSGNPPPTAFVVTLWIFLVGFAAATVATLVIGLRHHRASTELRRDTPPGVAPRDPEGHTGKAGCLLAAAVPCAVLAAFFLNWIIGIA